MTYWLLIFTQPGVNKRRYSFNTKEALMLHLDKLVAKNTQLGYKYQIEKTK